MLLTHLRVLLPHLLLAIISGAITSVILIGALLVGLSSVASVLDLIAQPGVESVQPESAIQYAGVAVLLASLLATAPHIGWGYNFLLRMFRLDKAIEEVPK